MGGSKRVQIRWSHSGRSIFVRVVPRPQHMDWVQGSNSGLVFCSHGGHVSIDRRPLEFRQPRATPSANTLPSRECILGCVVRPGRARPSFPPRSRPIILCWLGSTSGWRARGGLCSLWLGRSVICDRGRSCSHSCPPRGGPSSLIGGGDWARLPPHPLLSPILVCIVFCGSLLASGAAFHRASSEQSPS